MVEQPIEQFMRRSPKRQRPNYIPLPTSNRTSSLNQPKQAAQIVKPQGVAKSSTVPRPPIPPRRHTLAEICRYADEQCAYIEWMTRQLEAEEAARRHSSPTTPMGAITNPFSGPADMWWRPVSANEMYGKSALRCQQEEEQEKIQRQNPYLAMNGFPDVIEKDPKVGNSRRSTMDDRRTITERILPIELTDEPSEIDEEPTNDCNSVSAIQGPAPTEDSICVCKREDRTNLERPPPTIAVATASDRASHLPILRQSSIVLMIPKAMLCFILLPIVLVVLWGNIGCDMDVEEHREEG